MMEFRFVIPGRLPGLNEIIYAARSHWSKGSKQKKEVTRLCAQYVLASRVPVFKKPIAVSFSWFEKDLRRDIDNISAGSKFILDALVETGRLKGDGRKWVKFISHEFPDPEPENPRVVVGIRGIDEYNV